MDDPRNGSKLPVLGSRGCTDIRHGRGAWDSQFGQKHLDADPGCIHMRVSNEYFPMINHRRVEPSINGRWLVCFLRMTWRKQFGHEDFFAC